MLKSAATIEFGELPQELGEIENGWFALSSNGELLASITRANSLIIWDEQGKIIDTYRVEGADALTTTVLDAGFSPDGTSLVSVHAEGGAYYVAYRWLGAQHMEYFQFQSADVPLRVWMNATAWLELSTPYTGEKPYVLQLLPTPLNRLRVNEILTDDEWVKLSSGPENDPDAFLRIGRIDPPLAVTVTREGLTKRWDLDTGEVTAIAQLDTLPGLGQVNAAGTHFAWRDGDSAALHLLNFETGEERLIAPLGGTYIPFLFLTPAADVIMGVNVGLEPIVVAWDVATGERIELGEYRQCNRQPDMARLSQDGTTLVIGCDTGLDIWRVADE